MSVMNDSPVDCQNANGTEPQRDPLTLSAKKVENIVISDDFEIIGWIFLNK